MKESSAPDPAVEPSGVPYSSWREASAQCAAWTVMPLSHASGEAVHACMQPDKAGDAIRVGQ